jgi:hypothetical protein
MSDLTAARDRLVMKIAVAAAATHAEATEIVDWLQTNPEVLRALAGVPTADVAAVVAPPAMTDALIDAQRELRVLRAERDAAVGLASLPRRVVTAIASVMDGGAAVSEGVDAADEQPSSEYHRKSAEIVNSGRCLCTEDEACQDHEALEMRAELQCLRARVAELEPIEQRARERMDDWAEPPPARAAARWILGES